MCGLLTMIQNCFWKPLKNSEPAFIQGMTKDQMQDNFEVGCRSDWRCICIDGSGFDSTQNHLVM